MKTAAPELSSSFQYTTTTNHGGTATTTANITCPPLTQILNTGASMEAAAHVNLLEEDEEKDPLAFDSSLEQSDSQDHEQEQHSTNSKHTHSLRRHVPRIIVKPIPPEKRTPPTTSDEAMTSSAALAISGLSSRGSSSRRIQQQQAKAAALAAASSATSTASCVPTATAVTQASTMREVLASIPGFSVKPRRRSSKKISTAAQIEQTKDGKIDLETPDSILASTNLRALLNKQTFSLLPPLYQYNLIQLLPSVDREAIEMEQRHPPSTVPMEAIRLGPSSLNNEFFARACLEWRERLAEGEFTPENQMKLKTEAEREKNKLDPWKLKHFEPIWGERSINRSCGSSGTSTLKLESTGSTTAARCNNSDSVDGAPTCASLSETNLELKPQTQTNAEDLTATKVHTTEDKTATVGTASAAIKAEDNDNKTAFNNQKSDNFYYFQVEQTPKKSPVSESYEVICDKQTDANAESKSIVCTSASSAFDLLRIQKTEHTTIDIQKKAIKRPSASPSSCENFIAGDDMFKVQQESKQIKIENRSDHVPSNSTSLASETPITFQKQINCKNTIEPTAKTQELDSTRISIDEERDLAAALYRRNQEQQPKHSTTPMEGLMTNAEVAKSQMQFLAHISSSASNLIVNSTCDSIPRLLSSSTSSAAMNAIVAAQQAPSRQELQLQLNACTTVSLDDDDDELIEQKFADAENYVLESGEVSTDSSADAANVQSSAKILTANKGSLNEGQFLFSGSLDHDSGYLFVHEPI